MLEKARSTAIVGLGKIGMGFDLDSTDQQVFSHTKAVMLHPGFQLVAGVDPAADKRDLFHSRTGIPAYPSIEAMYASINPEFVILAVPTAEHFRSFESIAPHAPRLMLIEKPIAISSVDARTMQLRARELSIDICVNYMRAFDPGILVLGSEIRAKRWGRFLGGNINYSRGLLTNASHYLQLLFDWFGPSTSSKVYAARASAKDLAFDLDIDAALRFDDAWVTLHAASNAQFGIGEIDLLFESGRVTLSEFTERIAVSESESQPTTRGVRRLVPGAFAQQPQMDRYQYNVLQRIHESMLRQESFVHDLQLSVDIVLCCEALAISASEFLPPKVSPEGVKS